MTLGSGARAGARAVGRRVRALRPAPESLSEQHPQVSVLVVSYNGRRHLARLLRSIRSTRGTAHELVVVDNASGRSTRRLLLGRAGRAVISTLVLLDRNTLFSPGVNTALAVSDQQSPLVLLLNPDITIVDPDWLTRLVAVHQRGATSLGHIDDAVWPRGDGYCLLVDRDLFTAAGGLSTEFHWWWAVTKLQADLLAAGHQVQAVTDHDDVLVHVGGGSGRPPLRARGMATDDDVIRGWFAGRRVAVLKCLP